MQQVFKWFLVLALGGLLMACESTKMHQPQQNMTVSIAASQGINSSADQQALPVLVKVYQLTNKHNFLSASFNQLWHDDVIQLGESLVRHTEVMVSPGQRTNVNIAKSNDARFIAAVAIMRDKSGKQWRDVKTFSGSNQVNLELNAQGIHINS